MLSVLSELSDSDFFWRFLDFFLLFDSWWLRECFLEKKLQCKDKYIRLQESLLKLSIGKGLDFNVLITNYRLKNGKIDNGAGIVMSQQSSTAHSLFTLLISFCIFKIKHIFYILVKLNSNQYFSFLHKRPMALKGRRFQTIEK